MGRWPGEALGSLCLECLFALVESRAAHAGVAQLVEHHLAKVRVAGSSPVARSVRWAGAAGPSSLKVEVA